MKKGFTLLELIVVIIIIGILATLGFTQYVKIVEKGRTTEAKMILGQIRTANEAYKLEYGTYAGVPSLAVNVPDSCVSTHYFRYQVDIATATTFIAAARRCTAGGKTPNAPAEYLITLDQTGTFGGTAGYY